MPLLIVFAAGDPDYIDKLNQMKDAFNAAEIGGTFETIVLNGGQISFPATQNPSADPNTLDDYEEGTFTPAVTFGGANTGIAYTTRVATYTKNGNRVDVSIYVKLSAKGSSAGAAKITNLPFTSVNVASLQQPVAGSMENLNTITTNNMPFWVAPNSTEITLQYLTAGARAAVTDAHCMNNTDFNVGGSYQTA